MTREAASLSKVQHAERRYIPRALEQVGVATHGLRFSDDRSAVPDAHLHLDDGRVIGIEQTQIRVPGKRGRRMGAREARHQQVMDAAEKIYCDRHPQPRALQVSASLGEGRDVRDSDVEPLAASIAHLVLRFEHMASPGYHIEPYTLYQWGWPLDKELPVEDLWIWRSEQMTQSCWTPSHACMVPPLTAEIVQACIDVKEEHYERYAHGANDVWLVLTMESGSPSTHLDLEWLPPDHVFSTRFGRVLLDQIVGSNCRDLKIALPQ